MTVARRVRVHGRVQGVFFRDSTRREAEARGVSGWVANRDDGTVEALFEGEASEVDALVAWCRSGPSRAQVDAVDVVEAAPSGDDGFAIL